MKDQKILPFPEPEGDIWQVGEVVLPTWVDEDPPWRPRIAIAVSAETGLIGSSDIVAPASVNQEMAIAAVESLAETVGNLPVKVEVDRPEYAEALADAADACGFFVKIRDDLPLLDEPVRAL